MKYLSLFAVGMLLSFSLAGQKKGNNNSKETSSNENLNSFVSGFSFRSIGPSITSGRIVDLVVNPNKKSQWYIATASSGVWKTDNAGVSFQPIFEKYASYSVGCISMDPKNEHVLWIGTGENNNQRSVSYGDGVYKTLDGGKTWKNMGLKLSEHIGMIAIDPQNSNHVYVAAYGPLWSSGGDRGVYKTEDGGNTWKQVLSVSEHTGFNEVHIDQNHPNIVYATAHQRRRHEWTYLGGGPESAIYKSTDFGATWKKLEGGLPKGDLGRISIALPKQNQDMLYALIEGGEKVGGVYLSTDRGESWKKQSSYTTSGNYYNEIFVDPKNVNKIYSMNTFAEVSLDGGKSFKWLGEKNKHVDNHVIWVDEADNEHYLMGCDGGLYETWDAAKTWDFKANLPLTQFYRVTADNAYPFYNVYGGTQDNNTLGGPSRTKSASGIHNYDWFVTVEGDGFKTVVDPTNPDIIYSQWQYGGLVRHNKKTGEVVDIRPKELKGAAAYRFNWDAPILISKYDHKTLYFAAQYVFKSTDMGNTWTIVSKDLSRQLDRNQLKVMDKVWSVDAVAKNQSTSIYGNITALAESPINKNILYAGTDDGLIYISENGGTEWKKMADVPGIPNMCLVQNLYASRYDENTAYVVFNHHRSGDFKPYLMKTTDKGKTWTNISNNLPERGSVQCFAEDHINRNLMFAGTEFGLYTSVDAGANWVKITGLPTISIREIVIQERENDLVLATFGRGIYILDDYSPLQNYMVKEPMMKNNALTVYPIKDGLVFIETKPLGHKGKSFQGESFYTADNPAMGAVFTYYVKDEYLSIKESRQKREEKQVNDYYPSLDSLYLEDKELETYLLAVVTDLKGNVVRSMKVPHGKGMHRVVWDGRYDVTSPITFYKPNPDNPYEGEDMGPLATPGEYLVDFKLYRGGELKSLGTASQFKLTTLYDSKTDLALNEEIAEVRRIIGGVHYYCNEMSNRMKYIRQGEQMIQNAAIMKQLGQLEMRLDSILVALRGDGTLASREFETKPGIIGQLEGIVYGLWSISSEEPPAANKVLLSQIKDDFSDVYDQVMQLSKQLESFEQELDAMSFPYTPGRLPVWQR